MVEDALVVAVGKAETELDMRRVEVCLARLTTVRFFWTLMKVKPV